MADLTAQTEIGTDWTEVTSEFSMTDEESYVMDIAHAEMNSTVYSAETDTNSEPSSDVIGHPWRHNTEATLDPREYKKKSGVYLWLRVDRRTAQIISTKV